MHVEDKRGGDKERQYVRDRESKVGWYVRDRL